MAQVANFRDFGREASRAYAAFRLRRMPNFFIRLRRVLGFKSGACAAPLGPSMRHPTRSSMTTMWLRSTSASAVGSAFASPELGDEYSEDAAEREFVSAGGLDKGKGFATKLQSRSVRHDRCTLNNILQFTQIAGPGVLHQSANDVNWHMNDSTTNLRRIPAEEVIYKKRYVFHPFPQWWHSQGENTESVIQVLSNESRAPPIPSPFRSHPAEVPSSPLGRLG